MNKLENLDATIQLINHYIENSNIHVIKTKLPDGTELNYSIEVNISSTIKNTKFAKAQVKLSHIVKAQKESEEFCDISATIVGEFKMKLMENDEQYNTLLKNNAVPILSQILRAYMISLSALSGITNITFPVINYVNFFKQAQVEDENPKAE